MWSWYLLLHYLIAMTSSTLGMSGWFVFPTTPFQYFLLGGEETFNCDWGSLLPVLPPD